MRMTDFQVGWAIVGNDGRRVGAIKGVTQNYILATRPGFAADLYVPVSSIANVEHGTVHLNITHNDVEQMGWEQPPRDDDPAVGPESDLHRHV
jgi:hypothetical protein